MDYITKPFQSAEVLSRIKAHILLRRMQQELETKNSDLIRINTELENAYIKLANAQQLMLQQEKMASIGQLAAGVAHGINNPLGFIISNISVLKAYADKYASLYDLLKPGENKSIRIDGALTGFLKENNFEFINEDIENLIHDTSEGLDRVSRIVKSLGKFARIDSSSEIEPYDLNEEIENVLNITRNDLNVFADIRCELAPLPELYGHTGQINQVLLNMLLNAGEAIKRKNSFGPGAITIRTWQESGTVKLSIRDNGEGVEPDQINRIFDPFFTTKQVGEGIGLGLSISYDIIVNMHFGKIEVQSERGQWTEFVITLPAEL